MCPVIRSVSNNWHCRKNSSALIAENHLERRMIHPEDEENRQAERTRVSIRWWQLSDLQQNAIVFFL